MNRPSRVRREWTILLLGAVLMGLAISTHGCSVDQLNRVRDAASATTQISGNPVVQTGAHFVPYGDLILGIVTGIATITTALTGVYASIAAKWKHTTEALVESVDPHLPASKEALAQIELKQGPAVTARVKAIKAKKGL